MYSVDIGCLIVITWALIKINVAYYKELKTDYTFLCSVIVVLVIIMVVNHSLK